MHDSIGYKKLLYWIIYLKSCAIKHLLCYICYEKNLLFLPLGVFHQSQDGSNIGAAGKKFRAFKQCKALIKLYTVPLKN